MQDVTSLFENYRECVRHLWNTYYRAAAEPEQDWDLRDEFSAVAQGIFASLVLRPLEAMDRELTSDWALNPLALEGFYIVPISEHGVPIQINSALPRARRWESHSVERVRPNEVELIFARFFDWDSLGFRDFRYYEVLIQASELYPDIVGRVALIECAYATVWFDEIANLKSKDSPQIKAPRSI